jgi:hypothetical protein
MTINVTTIKISMSVTPRVERQVELGRAVLIVTSPVRAAGYNRTASRYGQGWDGFAAWRG